MIYLFFYFLIGAANYTNVFRNGGNQEGFSGVVEFLFFLLLWPVQALFFLFVGLTTVLGWLAEKIVP